MIVYLLLNTVNCKGYVGQHKGDSISGRWNKQLDGANTHLHAAKEKYGVRAFTREILGVVTTQEELTHLEKLWILTLRTYDPDYGYNMTKGGEGGQVLTEEVRKRMSVSGHSRWDRVTEEEDATRRTKIATSLTGIERSKETRRRISASRTGKSYGKQKPESVTKRAATHTGMKRSPAAIANMVEGQRIRREKEGPMPAEQREKISKTLTGRKQPPRSDEAKLHASEARLRYLASKKEACSQ